MEKITIEQLEKKMDEMQCGSPSIDEIEAIAKERGATTITYIALVGFINPFEINTFFADTKEDMAAQIEQAANGREYVARYSGFTSICDQTSAPIEN